MNSKITTNKLCTLAMLVAISFLLGALAIRIGSGIKLSFKFIPVFICSSLYGPFLGGLCGAVSDFLSYFLNPGSGAYMPQISLVELLYGISFGLFFYKAEGLNAINIIKVFICSLLNTILLSLLLMSYILMDFLGLTYIQTIGLRIPSSIVNMVIQVSVMIALLTYMPTFKKFLKIK